MLVRQLVQVQYMTVTSQHDNHSWEKVFKKNIQIQLHSH